MSTFDCDGGPAFPVETTATPYAPGMSLRDYFAAHAMAGLLASNPSMASDLDPHKVVAHAAYKSADAMIAARERKE